MACWAGELTAKLNGRGPLFTIVASLQLSSAGNRLVAPPITAIFFTGDKADGSGNEVIEELSDSSTIAQLLVSKLGAANVWVMKAANFNGHFAVYKEFVPTVNSVGDPRGYDPVEFPASKSIISLISNCTRQVRAKIGDRPDEPVDFSPSTVLVGFSKGGIILNQILSEISIIETRSSNFGERGLMEEMIFLRSISEFHFVDVGLNCPGAYLTDSRKIKKIGEIFHQWHISKPLNIVLHGTPRQWCDSSRPWICEEKDKLAQLLRQEEASTGMISFKEVMYFANMSPSLQMHFEIIKALQLV